MLQFLFEKYGLYAFQNDIELQSIKFLKVLKFSLFIQICYQVSLSLKLGNANRLICLVFETWSDHYLLSKILIKMGVLIPSPKLCFHRNIKLVAIILFEIAVYYFDNSMITQTIFEGICLHKWKFRICS